jgi:hypothetical protein
VELISKSSEHNRISVGVGVGDKVAQLLISVLLSSAVHLAAHRFSSASPLVEAEKGRCRGGYNHLGVTGYVWPLRTTWRALTFFVIRSWRGRIYGKQRNRRLDKSYRSGDHTDTETMVCVF